jgi:putative DNA primase/helicase
LRTGIARPATRSDKVTRFSPVNYDRTATCPRFEQFISEVFAGNSELIGYIQKAIGYSLTGSVGEQCLFACHGDGRNGKSTLLEVLLHILGDYAIDLPFSVLEAKTNGNPPGEGVNLPGTRFAKVVEIREGRRLDEARIKSWTGGDTMTVRPLYRNAFSFHPTHKLWLAFNHKPVISDNSPGMWRRIRLIPFLQKFEGPQRDSGLLDKLKSESSGIINWAIEGCRRWQREGLRIPDAVTEATHQYQDESDSLVPFLEDRCVLEPSEKTPAGELWAEYLAWVTATKTVALSRPAFADHLKRRNLTSTELGHDKTRTWLGIGIRLKDAGVRAPAGTV